MDAEKNRENQFSQELDRKIKDSVENILGDFFDRKNKIIDFIMQNPDLPISYDQIVFLVRHSSPAIDPERKDYYDVLARLVSEARRLEDFQLMENIYLSIPFYPADPENQRRRKFLENGIQYLTALGLHQVVGHLYASLANEIDCSTQERIRLCEKAMEHLDKKSNEFAGVYALQEAFYHMELRDDPKVYRYNAFGEKIIHKGNSVFLSTIYPYSTSHMKEKSVCTKVNILKGNSEPYKSLNSFEHSGYDKEIIDEAMTVDTVKKLLGEKELLRHPDEKVICQADGKEYTCHVYTIRRVLDKDERYMGVVTETVYYAEGIGPIHAVICVDDKKYVYNLFEYSIKGGDGFVPCCVKNQWLYKQENCPDNINQVIKREIIAQDGDEYLLAGLDYAGHR